MRIQGKLYKLCTLLILLNFVYCENENVENILNLIKDANDNIEVKDHDEIVLVFGTGTETNSGLIKFVTGHSRETDFQSLGNNIFSLKDTSKAIKVSYPKLYYDKNNEATFYDCTRFGDISDTKDLMFPIVSSFYMEKITEMATKIKIIFLMEYSNNDETNYNNVLLLLEQAKNIFNDIGQYSNNIGLIITSANRQQRIDTRKISEIENKLSDPSLKTIYSLLFNRISRFEEAYIEGSLPELNNGKNKIKEYIDRLQYRAKTTNDFIRSLSTDSKQLLFKITNLINSLRKNITDETSILIENYFYKIEKTVDDIEDFKDLISKSLNRISNIIDSYYDNLDAERFVYDISEYLQELNIEVPKNLHDDVLKYDKILNVFSIFDTDNQIKILSIQWATALEAAETILDRLNCLYIFFKDFSNQLSTSAVLNNEADLGIKNYFKQLVKTVKTRRYRTEIFDGNNRVFYTKIMKKGNDELTYNNSHLYYRIQNRTLNFQQHKIFYQIYTNSFNSLTLDCKQSNKITVTAYNLKYSEIELYHNNNNACKDKQIIEIFVRNRIILNDHFGNTFFKNIKHVLIVAPIWEKDVWCNTDGAKTTGPLIGIGANFVNHRNDSWNLETERQERLRYITNLKIIDLNGNIKIDEFSKNNVQLPQLGENINSYKKHMHDMFTDPINKRSFDQFLKTISANNDVNELYNIDSFYSNLNLLEDFYYNKKGGINYVPLYESLARATQLYMENSPPKTNFDLKEVQKKLYSAALSRVINLTTNKQSSLVLDHEKYLSFAMDSANEFKDARSIHFVNERHREYNSKINKKIEEGAQYIEKELKPETERLNNQLTTSFRVKLVKEIKELEKKAIQEKKDLTKMIIGQSIATVLSLIGTGLSFLGPVGMGIGTALNVGGSIIKSATSSPMPTIREDLRPKINSLSKFVNTQQQYQRGSIDRQIKVLEECDDMSLQKIAETAKEYLDKADKDELEKAQTFISDKIDEIKKIKPNLPKTAITAMKTVKGISKLATVSTEIYATVKDDVGKILEMSSMLEKKDAEIKNLVNLRNSVSNSFVPLLKNMANDLTNQIDNMKDKSRISLYIKQYKIQQTLGEFQTYMKDLTTGFEVQAEVLDFMNKLNRAIEATITMFNLIQTFEEQKDLATYIADIQTAGKRENLVGGQYSAMADNLTLYIHSNIVLDNYLVAVNSLKQFVFPFASFYSDAMFLPDELKNQLNIKDLAVLVSDKIEELQKKTKEFTSTHNNDRSFDLMIYYDIPKTFSKPFYTWSDEKYRPLISSLLKGEEIILESELFNDTRNGLKFSEIEFSIKSHNTNDEETLKNLLNYYVVDLVHLGNSYYKCNNKVYVISSGSASLRHSFYKDSKDKLIYESKLHRDLSANKFILSPYASWKVKLTDETRHNDFSKLATIDSSDLYLELSGRAQYVPDDIKCDYNLDKYYKLDSIL